MRQSAVDHALALFARYHIQPAELRVLDVGGTRQVWLELNGEPTRPARVPLMRRLSTRLAPAPNPGPTVIVTDNPLLAHFPRLQFLDYGFNEDALGTGSDLKADFLDPAAIAGLKGQYDLVVSFDTLEHIADPFRFCRHLVEVTRTGAYIYLATVFSWEYHPSPRDYFRFSPDGLAACFASAPATLLECDWHVPGVSVFAFLRRD